MAIPLPPRAWVRVPMTEQGRTLSGAVGWPKPKQSENRAEHREEPKMSGEATAPTPRPEPTPVDVKPSRSDKGRRLLTERDRVVLTWVAEQYGAPVDQLQRLLARDPGRELITEGSVSLSGARHVVRRWEEGGYAESRKVFFKEQPWVWPTRKALQHLRLDLPFHRPSVALLEHHRWVNEARLYLEGPAYPDPVTWRSERLLKPRDARAHEIHYADAEAEIGPVTVAIEVELEPKKPAGLRLILGDLVARYEEVWYFAHDKARPGVERAVDELDPTRREQVQILGLPKPKVG